MGAEDGDFFPARLSSAKREQTDPTVSRSSSVQRRLFVTSLVCGAAGSGCSAASFALWGTQTWWWCAAAFVVGMTLVARLLRGGLEGGSLSVGLAASVGALAALGVVVAGRSTVEALAVGSALAVLTVFLARGHLEWVVRVATALCVALTIVGAGLEAQRRISAIRAAERLRLEILALPSMVVPPCGAAGSIMSRTPEGNEETVWRVEADSYKVERRCRADDDHDLLSVQLTERPVELVVWVPVDESTVLHASTEGVFRSDFGPTEAIRLTWDGALRARREHPGEIGVEIVVAIVAALFAWWAAPLQRRHTQRRLASLARAVDGARGARLTDEMTMTAALLVGTAAVASALLVSWP